MGVAVGNNKRRGVAVGFGAAILLALGLAVGIRAAYAAVPIYVDLSATGANDGSSWTDAFADLEDALAVATPGDTIFIAEGTYAGELGNFPNFSPPPFILADGVTLAGGYQAGGVSGPNPDSFPTIISGDALGNDAVPSDPNDSNRDENALHVFQGQDLKDVVLQDLTISDGHAAQDNGGGLHLTNVDIELINVTIEDNVALTNSQTELEARGGGIFLSGGSIVIEDSVIARNHTQMPEFATPVGFGSALYAETAEVTVQASTFENNQTPDSTFDLRPTTVDAVGSLLIMAESFIDESANAFDNGGVLVRASGGLPSGQLVSVTGSTFTGNSGGSATLLISGDGAARPESVIEGSTFTRSAVAADGADLRVQDSTIDGRGSNFTSVMSLEDGQFSVVDAVVWSGHISVFDGGVAEITGLDALSGNVRPAGLTATSGAEVSVVDALFAQEAGTATPVDSAVRNFGGDITILRSSFMGISMPTPVRTTSGTTNLVDSTLLTNTAASLFFQQGGDLRLTNLEVVGNEGFGPASSLFSGTGGTIAIENSLIADNVGSSKVLDVSGASIDAVNSTFVDNGDPADASWAVFSGSGSLDSVNSIWWQNGQAQSPPLNNGSGTINFATSIVDGSGGSAAWDAAFGVDGGGNLDLDPMFIDPASGHYRLGSGTPAADLGNSGAVPADVFDVDQDGDTAEPTPDLDLATRIVNAAVDIGAFESDEIGLCQPTLHVDASGPDGTGLTWATALADPQDALALARGFCAGIVETIQIAEGTYTPAASDQTVSFELVDGVEVVGGYQSGGAAGPDNALYPTILSGDLAGDDSNGTNIADNAYNVVRSDPNGSTGSVLRSVTVTAGNASQGTAIQGTGGGIYANSPLTIVDVDVVENRAVQSGGGAFLDDDNVEVISSRFLNNTAASGGGMLVRGDGITIRDSEFEGNSATSTSPGSGGGGLYINGSADVTTSVFRQNTANLGGGIRLFGDTMTLTNIVVENNDAAAGAGVFARDTNEWSITNSLVINNDASTNGGGLMAWSSDVLVTNSTIADNTAANLGAGIYHVGSANVSLQNTIVWDNVIGGFATVVATHSNTPTLLPGTGNTAVNPQFVGGGDYRLGASPLLDEGDDTLVPSDAMDVDGDGDVSEPVPDLDLEDRIQESAVDMGAFEGAVQQPDCPAGIYVDGSVTGGDGLGWLTAFADVQDALALAGSCSGTTTIFVATGTYYPAPTDPGVAFELLDGLTIIGGWETGGTAGPDNNLYPTELSGDLAGDGNDPATNADNSEHVLVADGVSDFTVEHVTVIGGASPDNGGGLLAESSTGVLRSVRFAENSADGLGGGIWVGLNTTVEVRDSDITNNAAQSGGGIAVRSLGSLQLLTSHVADNIATSDGGGLHFLSFGAENDVFATEFVNNSAGNRGGAVFSDSARVDFASVVITGNDAARGGGIYLDDDGENFSATEYPSLFNVTIADNSATIEAGGIWVEIFDCFECDPTGPFGTEIQNSIVASNTAPSNPNVLAGGDFLSWYHSNVEGSGGSANWDFDFGGDQGGNIDEDPKFFDLANGIVSLSPGSPSIDTGDSTAANANNFTPEDEFDIDEDGDVFELVPAIDLTDRVQGAEMDMGAFERAPGPTPLQLLPISSCPIYDSRTASGALTGAFDGGESRTVQVTGSLPSDQGVGTSSCVPNDALAVVVTITAADPQALGNLRMVPAGETVNGGVVNYAPNGLNNTNTVTVPISVAGAVDVSANGGPNGLGAPSTDVRIVAVGYYPDPATVGGGDQPLSYNGITPCAVADSRPSQGASGAWLGPFTTGDSYPDIDILGAFPAAQGGGNTDCGIPEDAVGVVANLVAVNATGVGTLAAAPAPQDPSEPTTSFAPIGMNNATTVVLPLTGDSLAIDIEGDVGATANIRVVVFGYLAPDGDVYRPVTPCAAFDTRPNVGAIGDFAGLREGDETTTYDIAGLLPAEQGGLNDGDCGVPSSASSVLINLVAVGAQGFGNLQAAATGTTPTGGLLNFAQLQPAMNNSNAVVVPLDSEGRLDVRVNGGPTGVGVLITHIRGVVLGYYE